MAAEMKGIEVSATELKNAWHEFLDPVAQSRQEVIIPRQGRSHREVDAV